MTTAALVVVMLAKSVVAAVLLSSGIAKLVEVEQAPVDGRLPQLLALLDRRAGRLALGSVEVVLGAASILALGSPVVDAAILVLCAGFLVGSAVLATTRPGTACQCFGAASSSTFGARHTLLTALLAVCAGVALAGALQYASDPGWSWHPLMLVTLAGLVLLAGRVRRLPDMAHRRSA